MACKHCELKEYKDDTIRGQKFYEMGYKDSDGTGWIQPSENNDGFEIVVLAEGGYTYVVIENVKFCPFCGDNIKLFGGEE